MNDILTHVIGMRQLVVVATKRNDLNQSKERSFVQIDSSFLYSLRQIGILIALVTYNRILSQNIYRQVTFSVKALLITGLITDLIAHYSEITDMYLPRSRRVTKSVIII